MAMYVWYMHTVSLARGHSAKGTSGEGDGLNSLVLGFDL